MSQKIEALILDQFKITSSKVGDCIPERWILHTLSPSLNAKEQNEIQATVDDLVQREIIKLVSPRGMLDMALAQNGYDLIYPKNSAASTSKIRSAILARFAELKSNVGDCIDEKWLIHKLIPSLNPEERKELNPTIDDLVNEGLITTGERMGMMAMILSEKGFNTIY